MKSRRTILAAAAVLVLVLVGCIAAAAGTEPAVIYNGSTKKIEFQNAWPFGSGERPDLFTDMKGLMPGDKVTQEITVGAKNLGMDTVRIHLRAQNPNADYVKLVHTHGDWVTFTVKNGDQVITGDLEEGVVLGTFDANKKTTVTVELAIDREAGNALQALTAEIDWVFTAEVLPGTVIPPSPSVEPEDLPWLTTDHINYLIGYDDGLVHPDDPITRAEVATIFYRLLRDDVRARIWSTESIYPDVTEDAWYYVAVCTITNGGILEGYPDGTFQPDDPITRAELATIISRFDARFGKLEINESFPDAKGHWAQAYIEFAATRRYVIGYPDGLFRPDQDITRAETVTMINRCLQRVVDREGITEEYINWPDNLPGTWYYFEILEAANNHDFARSDRKAAQQAYCCENWTGVFPPIDWARVEREWLLIYTAQHHIGK